ncbi:50S ribosomal protein L37e [Candidatus Woesearchaeota archaeon]|nr:50S ribosomal protein L37e [Candidatus Woesearchaeota archaeon]
MTKGTSSMGKKSGKDMHIRCRRCGKATYHKKKHICSYCGYGKTAKMRKYTWQSKTLSGKKKNTLSGKRKIGVVWSK